MTTLKRIIPFFLVGLLAITLSFNPLVALAWNENTEGNSVDNNSSNISGESSGKTEVEGWIGTFDGGEDPNRPDPPEDAWIKVTIPTTALFGSLASDEKSIYSPVYHLYNHSVRGVEVTPSSFEAISEASELSGMTLNLNFTTPKMLSIALRNASNEFLGSDFTQSDSVILDAKTDTEASIASFNMTGTLADEFVYPQESPYTPNYNLMFTFKAITPVTNS